MFGMFDYRAYKLLWLLFLPWRWAVRLAGYVLPVVVAFGVHVFFPSYPYILKLVGTIFAFEVVIGIPFMLIVRGIDHVLLKVFFWVIDVVPAHGKNEEEARIIAQNGPAYELGAKFDSHIDTWTEDDTEQFVSLMSWRARWFFPVRARFEHVVRTLKELQAETGQQPYQLGEAAIKKIRDAYSGGREGQFEKWFVNTITFNLGLRVLLASLVLYLLGVFHSTA